MTLIDWLVILPPLTAIILAVVTRDVMISLLAALLFSETLLARFNPGAGFLNAVERAVEVASDPGNARVLMFCLGVGALLALMRDGGGVAAFVQALVRSSLARGRRRTSALPAIVGAVIFIETNLSLLASGVVARDLFDAQRISRARLAYLIDSTSSPVSVLALLNGWGAYVLALLAPYALAEPARTLAFTVPLNFYALATLGLVIFTVAADRTFGPMAQSDARALTETVETLEDDLTPQATHPAYMLVPLGVMIIGILAFLAWTGQGDLLAGSGSQSVLWAVSIAVVTAGAMLMAGRGWSIHQVTERSLAGLAELLPAVSVLFFSIALGASLRELGVGDVVARGVGTFLPVLLLPTAVFAATAVMSFATGTSWGSYAIMIPIALPLALDLGMPPSLLLAAVMGGGVFGDHCSPISDTTVIASLAAGVDHLEHVRTQLPYALVGAGAALLGYLAAGVLVAP